ncbi:MAG: hypothetical protein ABEL04_11985 [Salinibacter sp.]|uniref:hypothetical protein n=1 Tax=Salinibacter sp. TaxID=2065818 RepID=UPI0035D401F0
MFRTVASFLAVLLALFATSCDFNAANDAVDQFQVLVEVPPLTTVVNLQVLNGSTGNPVSRDVQVAFDGPDAPEVIDVYSDPLSELIIGSGFASFGIDSTRIPSSARPVQITLHAQADGYRTTSAPLRIVQEGSKRQVLQLMPSNPERTVSGRSGARKTGSMSGEGKTSSAVTAETAKASGGSSAEATASIPAGTALQTASGTPLQGNITVDLSAFGNSADAQELLPTGARTDEEGQRRRIRGALRFQVQDDNGRVARQFGVSGSDTTTITADLPSVKGGDGTPTVTLVNPATGASQTYALDASSSAQAGSPKQQGTTTLQLVGGTVIVQSAEGTATVDPGKVGGALFAVMGVDPSETNTCTPKSSIQIGPNGHEGSVGLRIAEGGFSLDANVSIPDPNSVFTVSASSLLGGDIPRLGDVTLTVTAPDGQEVTTRVNLCSGTNATKRSGTVVTLPKPSSERIDATIRVLPDCPKGKKIPLTPPLDGYTVSYRPSGSNKPFKTIPKDNITINVTKDKPKTLKNAVVSMPNVLPDTEYKFVGTYGGQSSSRTVTMPAEDGGEITVTDERLRKECK